MNRISLVAALCSVAFLAMSCSTLAADSVAGTVKHPKKLTLSDTDVANVPAYIAANEPK